MNDSLDKLGFKCIGNKQESIKKKKKKKKKDFSPSYFQFCHFIPA